MHIFYTQRHRNFRLDASISPPESIHTKARGRYVPLGAN